MPPINLIKVSVVTQYLSEQSVPDDKRYAFAYHIKIENLGSQPAQLISRHWIITDGNDRVQEVKGPGVIGEQPVLKPGETFRYTSGTVMETVVGSMQGSYQMVAEDGTHFEADIAPFTLAVPNQVH